MRGKSLIYLLLFILLVSSVSALSNIEVNNVNNQIEFGEKAVFRIVVSNQREVPQTYSFLSSASLGWNVNTAPNPNAQLIVQPNQTKGMNIEVIPLERFKPGIYLVSLKVNTNKGEVYNKLLEVYIGDSTPREYQPALRTSVDLSEQVNPQEIQSIRFFLQNDNVLNYSGLSIKVKSDLAEFEQEQIIDLGPQETRTVEFTIEPNPFSQPKDYYLFFTVEKDGDILKSLDKKITIIPLTNDFVKKVDVSKSFLKTVQTVSYSNQGNVRNQQTVKVKISLLADLFTSTEPNAYTYKDEKGRYLAWDFELGVNENTSVRIVTSYRIPLIVLIILIILTFLYFIYKSPVRITKTASNIIMHEGGLSGLKITLVIKNLSNKTIKNVEVFDTAPSIASIEKDVEAGTLKPSDIKRNKQGGILLNWKISELEGREERLITYKIKSKLNIVGTISLPRAKVKFKVGPGKEKAAYSNVFRVGGELDKE